LILLSSILRKSTFYDTIKRAIVGALLFSGAVAFQLLLQSSGVQISPFLLDTIPYILTLLVLIVWGGARRHAAPAGLGRIYRGAE
jgi:ABC-type uncharacterized transport system permease subunit